MYFRGYESVPGVPEVLSRSASGGEFRVWCPDAYDVGKLPGETRDSILFGYHLDAGELDDIEALTGWLQTEMQRSPLVMAVINFELRPDSRFLSDAAMQWISHEHGILFLADSSTDPLDEAIRNWLPYYNSGTLVFRGRDQAPGFEDLATSEVVAAFTEVHDGESLLWWSDRGLFPP